MAEKVAMSANEKNFQVNLKHFLMKVMAEDIHKHKYAKRKAASLGVVAFAIFAFLWDGFFGNFGGAHFFNVDSWLYILLTVVLISIVVLIIHLMVSNKIPEIHSINTFHVPVHFVPIEHDAYLVVDGSGNIDKKQFEVNHLDLNKASELKEHLEEFTRLTRCIPVALSYNDAHTGEPNDVHKEEAALIENIGKVTGSLQTSEKTVVYLSAIGHQCRMDEFFEIAEKSIGRGRKMSDRRGSEIDELRLALVGRNKGVSIDAENVEQDIGSYAELSSQILRKYTFTMEKSIFHDFQESMALFNAQVREIEDHHYCPECNSDYIGVFNKEDYRFSKKKKEKKVLLSNTRMYPVEEHPFLWECPACSGRSATPFRRNKLEDDVFTPAYDTMAEEHFKERLEVYNHILDEKRKYAEKSETEFHRVLRESRSQVDVIKSKLRSITAEVRSDEAAISHLKEILLKYDQLQADRAERIDEEIDHVKAEIEANSTRAIQVVNETIGELKDVVEQKGIEYGELEAEDQRKRDQVQRAILSTSEQSLAVQTEIKNISESNLELNRAFAKKVGTVRKKRWYERSFGTGDNEAQKKASGKGFTMNK